MSSVRRFRSVSRAYRIFQASLTLSSLEQNTDDPMIGERSNSGSKGRRLKGRRLSSIPRSGSSMGTGQISMRPSLGTGQILAFASGGRFDGRGNASRSSIVLVFPFGVQSSEFGLRETCLGGGQERVGVSAMGRIGVFQSCSCLRPRRRLLPHEQNDHDHEDGLSVSTRFDPQRFNNQRSSTRTRTSTITIGEEAMPP